ncbi:MAG: sulfite exporter TauE/SafE family protein [Alphaproteobacteria bacterium]|uniref:Probable membrane transporter protein n=1 Tax=PS1 clade bacterium TaxID=2175152 RepID=A0A368DTW8_9PROT|nr:permease [Rhodobiaceae bacterium]OUT74757.1 MAG: permease [Rhizobiales bacterium TMED25]RCL74661.1 MAG: sulfite exporter TauE/SafE family protein [PS1 clade bacterium]
MYMYLPIAEVSVNILILFGMGGMVGILSGMFGVGGGFLMTPLLIFYGIPPIVAVATEANQIVASSISGAYAHWRRAAVDIKMGTILLMGGVIGSLFGIRLFVLLKNLGQIDLIISLSYVILLGIIGTLTFVEGIRSMIIPNELRTIKKRNRERLWIYSLPLRTKFKKSGLYISIIPPLVIGFFVGILSSIMGIGGGFIMVPAMIYLLRMPTNVVIGTSLYQIIFVTSLVTILHAYENQTVDIMLALILMTGGVVGAQIGAALGHRLKAEQLRFMLGILILAVCIKILTSLVIEPQDLLTITDYI